MHLSYVASNKVTMKIGACLYDAHGTCAKTAKVSRGTSHVTTTVHLETFIHHFGG